MKSLKISVATAAMVLGMAMTPLFSGAADKDKNHDLRVGSFPGNWYGMAARFDITKKKGDTWKFEGKILIKATNQYDRITIEQFADNSLRVRRFLQAEHTGKHQTLIMHRPESLLKNGHILVNFKGKKGSGIGANNMGFLLMSIDF